MEVGIVGGVVRIEWVGVEGADAEVGERVGIVGGGGDGERVGIVGGVVRLE